MKKYIQVLRITEPMHDGGVQVQLSNGDDDTYLTESEYKSILTAEAIHAEYEKELSERKEKESKCPICGAKVEEGLNTVYHKLLSDCPLSRTVFFSQYWLTLIERWEERK